MLRILYLGARHALGAGPFPRLGHSIVGSVENGTLLERLPRRAETPLSPRRQPQMPLSPRCQPHMLDVDETFTMVNVAPKATGLPMVVYVSFKNATHGPRVKVSRKYGKSLSSGHRFCITIQDDPSVIGWTGSIKNDDVKLVKRWISLNRDVLIRFWEHGEDFDVSDMLSSLKKI